MKFSFYNTEIFIGQRYNIIGLMKIQQKKSYHIPSLLVDMPYSEEVFSNHSQYAFSISKEISPHHPYFIKQPFPQNQIRPIHSLSVGTWSILLLICQLIFTQIAGVKYFQPECLTFLLRYQSILVKFDTSYHSKMCNFFNMRVKWKPAAKLDT